MRLAAIACLVSLTFYSVLGLFVGVVWMAHR